MVNTLASLPGTFAPFVTGFLVESVSDCYKDQTINILIRFNFCYEDSLSSLKGTREEWQVAIQIAGIFNIVGGIIYLLFAKGEVQPWALEQVDQNLKVSDEKKSILGNYDGTANCNVDDYGSIIKKKSPSSL